MRLLAQYKGSRVAEDSVVKELVFDLAKAYQLALDEPLLQIKLILFGLRNNLQN